MSSSSVEVLNVRLRRIDSSVSWGFNLQGGRDFSSPLMITKVAPNSLADKSLVRPGDYILRIGNRSVENFTHNDARNAILEQGNDLELTLQRNAIPRREDYLIHYDFPQHKLMNPESLEPVPHSGIPTGSPQVGIQLKDNRALLTQSYNSPLGLYSKQNVANSLATTIKNPSDEESNNNINNNSNSSNNNNNSNNNNGLNQTYTSLLANKPLNTSVNLNPTPKPFKPLNQNSNNNNNNNGHEIELTSFNKPDKTSLQKFETVTALPLKTFSETKQINSSNTTKENKYEFSKPNEINCNNNFNRNKSNNSNVNTFNNSQQTNSNSDKNNNKIDKKYDNNNNDESVYNGSFKSSIFVPISKNIIQSRISEVLLKKQAKMEMCNPVSTTSKTAATTTATTISTNNNKNLPINNKFNDKSYYNKYLNIDEKNILSEQTILQNLTLSEPPSSPFQSQSNPSSISNKPISNNNFAQNFSHQNFVRNNEPRPTPSYGGVNTNAQAPNFNSGPRNFNRGLKGSAILRAENSQATVPQCYTCGQIIRGPFISAVGKTWCPNHFLCANPSCGINLENVGFVEENGKLFCEHDYEQYFAPKCVKCHRAIIGDTCYALQKPYHPDCFTCAHCNKKIGSTGFHVEDGRPYCLKDYNELFSSKCAGCNFPIDAGDRFLEAMNQVFHVDCFTCTTCHSKLENVGFVVKSNKPYCKRHAIFT